jgi:hypothetical protein
MNEVKNPYKKWEMIMYLEPEITRSLLEIHKNAPAMLEFDNRVVILMYCITKSHHFDIILDLELVKLFVKTQYLECPQNFHTFEACVEHICEKSC